MEIWVKTEKGMTKSKVSHSVSIPSGLMFFSYLALSFIVLMELGTRYVSSRPVLLNGSFPWYEELEFHVVPYLPYVLLGSLLLLVLGSLAMLAHFRKRYATKKHLLIFGTILSLLTIVLYAIPNISFMIMGLPTVQANPHYAQLFYEYMSVFMLSMAFATLYLGPALIVTSALPRWRGAFTMLSMLLFLMAMALSIASITSARQFISYEGVFTSNIIYTLGYNIGQFSYIIPLTAMALLFGAAALMMISYFPVLSKRNAPGKDK